MKLAVHIGVKDEVELIGPCIAHCRAIGITQFIVCDMGSTDGTAEILAAEEGEGFRILRLTNETPATDWLAINAEAARGSDADWLFFADADEFILPASGSLRKELESVDADVLRIPRFNVPLTAEGPRLPLPTRPERYAEVDLIVKPLPDFRGALRTDRSLPWIRAVPVPKVAVRPRCVRGLVDGMHAVLGKDGNELAAVVARRIVTAHVPLTTAERFGRKIENIREVFRHHDAHMGADQGWHWRRWLELADRGELNEEFQRSCFTDEQLSRLRVEGTIGTAAEMLGDGP